MKDVQVIHMSDIPKNQKKKINNELYIEHQVPLK